MMSFAEPIPMIHCDFNIKQLCPYVKGKTKKIINHRLNNINIIIKSMSKPNFEVILSLQADDYLLVEISN